MWYLVLSVCFLGLLAALLGYFRQRKAGGSVPDVVIPPTCCGQHAVCERDSLRSALSPRIVYYEDEELDRFSGTPSAAYDEEAVDEFREVLYTLRPAEVSAWLHSLELRRIELPDSLKDEALLIVREQRIQA
jgi:hypothetical protein